MASQSWSWRCRNCIAGHAHESGVKAPVEEPSRSSREGALAGGGADAEDVAKPNVAVPNCQPARSQNTRLYISPITSPCTSPSTSPNGNPAASPNTSLTASPAAKL